MLVKKLYEDGVDKKFSFIGIAVLFIVVSGVCTLLHPSREQNDKSHEESPQTNDDIVQTKEVKGTQNAVQTTTGVTTDTPPIGKILRNYLFISHVVWLTNVLLKYVFFLGSANRLMEQLLQDEDRVSYFSDVMTFTMIVSLVSSFIAGYTIHAVENRFTGNLKAVIPLTVTSCLVILLSALAFVHTPNVLYADFIVLTFLRSFMYTTNMEFIRIAFPMRYMSVIFGIVISVSGILTMTQYGLFAWTEKYDGAMTHVNVFLLCLSTISLFHPMLVFYSHRRQQS
ncbi:solute carrier family 43 member 3-like [Mizuhopecten yessoensis]|uniref:Solute carrier family 43 member 3 n=1 Tax=Mizuhopecten yessoensis TaxID=6573 RepID=A0A210Q314_MIZYE|nr:solute carrier family 43 member 3-like [Mizuhopecten yessoensis]OWF43126.1 Solute carrier family 43 member 3 [Mizuhopecten yessoensis]